MFKSAGSVIVLLGLLVSPWAAWGQGHQKIVEHVSRPIFGHYYDFDVRDCFEAGSGRIILKFSRCQEHQEFDQERTVIKYWPDPTRRLNNQNSRTFFTLESQERIFRFNSDGQIQGDIRTRYVATAERYRGLLTRYELGVLAFKAAPSLQTQAKVDELTAQYRNLDGLRAEVEHLKRLTLSRDEAMSGCQSLYHRLLTGKGDQAQYDRCEPQPRVTLNP